jgi:hypothetical protein
MRAAEFVVVRRLGKSGGRRGDIAQLREVENLHSVIGRFAHDEGVVAIDFNRAPQRINAVGGQLAEIDGTFRVADVNEGRAVGQTHERVFFVGERIGPAPDVVARAAADTGERQEREEVNILTGERACHSVHARRQAHRRHRLSVHLPVAAVAAVSMFIIMRRPRRRKRDEQQKRTRQQHEEDQRG